MQFDNKSVYVSCGENCTPYAVEQLNNVPVGESEISRVGKSKSININQNYHALKDILQEYEYFLSFHEDLEKIDTKDAYEFVSLLRNNTGINVDRKVLAFSNMLTTYLFKILDIVKRIIEEEKKKNEDAKDEIKNNFDNTLVHGLQSVCNKNIKNYTEILHDIDSIMEHKDTDVPYKLAQKISSVAKSCRNDIDIDVYFNICLESVPCIVECGNYVRNIIETMEFVE